MRSRGRDSNDRANLVIAIALPILGLIGILVAEIWHTAADRLTRIETQSAKLSERIAGIESYLSQSGMKKDD